jgi:hypothetical protein
MRRGGGTGSGHGEYVLRVICFRQWIEETSMPISDAEAVRLGLLVSYAGDMYAPGKTKPNREPRIVQARREAIAYLTASDALMPKRASLLAGQKKRIGFGDVVFYGVFARNMTDPSLYTVAIRGTEDSPNGSSTRSFSQFPIRASLTRRSNKVFGASMKV